MAADQMPDGIRPDEARGPKRRRITAALPRVVLGIFAAFVVAGLLNVFGQTTTTSRTSTERANLTVTAPGALRGGLIFQLVIEVVARADLGDARLVLSQGWFSGFTTNSEVPQPSMQDSVNGRAVFGLGAMHAGDRKVLRIYFQVNPTTVAWDRAQDVELDDGTSRVAVVQRTTTVYP